MSPMTSPSCWVHPSSSALTVLWGGGGGGGAGMRGAESGQQAESPQFSQVRREWGEQELLFPCPLSLRAISCLPFSWSARLFHGLVSQ